MKSKALSSCVADFPSLSRLVNGQKLVFLDGPGGVQVPGQVIDAISEYYCVSNSNTHGFFPTAKETDLVIDKARQDMADFLGAKDTDTISFGQNMTTLTFSLSRALARFLAPGSEILITQLDHEANRGPWLKMREHGFLVREVKMLPEGRLDYEDLKNKIGPQTGLVAIGYASNAFGTVNDLKMVRALTKKANALMLVDAVHYAPHFSINVQELDCDFLLCSAYKFYGPHVGVLYSKAGVLDQLDTDRLITQEQRAPYLIETGTLNHAALAGVSAAVNYLSTFGHGSDQRSKLVSAMSSIREHEYRLVSELHRGLTDIAGLQIIGPDLDPEWHTPTLAFTIEGHTPEGVCKYLGKKNICAWDGHFYALRAIEVLGLLEKGGVTRLGISMYTSDDDVQYTVQCVKHLVKKEFA